MERTVRAMSHEDQDQDQPKIVEGDDFEIQVEAMSDPGEPHTRSGRRGRSRAMRLALGAIALAVLVAVVAGAFALTRGGGGGVLSGSDPFSGAIRNVLHVTPNPTPLPTWVSYPTPTLGQETPAALGSAPASCSPAASTPHAVPGSLSDPALGASPVWVIGFEGSHATLYINLGGAGPTRYGWMVFVTFAIEPEFTDTVVVGGVRLDDGTPLWMAALEPGQTYTEVKPSVAVTLDPQQPGLASFQNTSRGLGEDWAAWAAALYIPEAGCYALEATWPGGRWSGAFFAG